MDLDPERYGLQPGDDRQDRATPSQCLDRAYWASVLAASSHERREAKAAPEGGYSRADESIDIHGVHTPLDGIDADLARTLVTAGANFSAATANLEQTEQQQVISFLVDAVLRRHQFLTAKVKALTLTRMDPGCAHFSDPPTWCALASFPWASSRWTHSNVAVGWPSVAG